MYTAHLWLLTVPGGISFYLPHSQIFTRKIFGIFHFYYYLCNAVPVRPSPRLFDAGDDPGFFVFAKVYNYFDCKNKKSIFFAFSCYLPHSQTFSRKFLASFGRKAYLCKKKKRCQQYSYFLDLGLCFILMIMNRFMFM